MKRSLISLALALAATLGAGAQHGGSAKPATAVEKPKGMLIESLPLHLHLAGLAKADSPRIVEGHLVLSAAGPFRFVGAAFEPEGFAVIHPFDRNAQGVFVFAWEVPPHRAGPLAYRLVVDGVWIPDPANPRRVVDRSSALELSVADLPDVSDLRLGVYRHLLGEGRVARFIFQAAPGEIVSVCGSFDNWDPFIHEMRETRPGTYELELPLPPGVNYYCFVYRGESLPDPLNASRAVTVDGKVVSALVVGN